MSVNQNLVTIIDFIRYAASRFAEAKLCFGHSYDNAIDEATHLVLHTLHLPHDLAPTYGQAKLIDQERVQLFELIERRIVQRKPVAYITGEAWFAGLSFKVDERVLVPRSPIAELIQNGFTPWLDGRDVQQALDLCTGSGCIGIAMAAHNPDWQVDCVDISEEALELARENVKRHELGGQVRALHSDLFAALDKKSYDLIVTNPPYVTEGEYAALPEEYAYEPALGLKAGTDGLDIALRILDQATDHLTENGLLIMEVGESEHALSTLLPEAPFCWIEFKVGLMGVLAIDRHDLEAHRASIRSVLAVRKS